MPPQRTVEAKPPDQAVESIAPAAKTAFELYSCKNKIDLANQAIPKMHLVDGVEMSWDLRIGPL